MSRERILVVDDSPTILKLVQLALTKADYRVTTAASGAEGLAAAREERPALVLLDSAMPELDGWRWRRRWPRIPSWPRSRWC